MSVWASSQCSVTKLLMSLQSLSLTPFLRSLQIYSKDLNLCLNSCCILRFSCRSSSLFHILNSLLDICNNNLFFNGISSYFWLCSISPALVAYNIKTGKVNTVMIMDKEIIFNINVFQKLCGTQSCWASLKTGLRSLKCYQASFMSQWLLNFKNHYNNNITSSFIQIPSVSCLFVAQLIRT